MRASLGSLPNELLESIASLCDLQAIANLSLTARKLNDVTSPILDLWDPESELTVAHSFDVPFDDLLERDLSKWKIPEPDIMVFGIRATDCCSIYSLDIVKPVYDCRLGDKFLSLPHRQGDQLFTRFPISWFARRLNQRVMNSIVEETSQRFTGRALHLSKKYLQRHPEGTAPKDQVLRGMQYCCLTTMLKAFVRFPGNCVTLQQAEERLQSLLTRSQTIKAYFISVNEKIKNAQFNPTTSALVSGWVLVHLFTAASERVRPKVGELARLIFTQYKF